MNAEDESSSRKRLAHTLYMAALSNAVLWALSIIALIFVVRRCPSARGLFVILAGGVAAASAIIALLRKQR
jgi:hypothetical protein